MDISKFRSMRKTPGILAFAVKNNTAELLIYDVVGEDWFGDGVSAKGVAEQISGLPSDVDTILVRINSPGGEIFEGVAIMNALLKFEGNVKVQIDGLCASIASVIAMAGKEISMAETALLMIHNPWTMTAGDAADLRATADLLDKVRMSSMVPAYGRSGMTSEQIIAVMDEETWYSAAEAKAAGWVDSVVELSGRASAQASYDLTGFKHAPKASFELPKESGNPPEPTQNDDISARLKAKALIIAAKRAENLRLAELS
jgi:ATP-dependent protease ClpP protease subunit